MKKWDSEEQRSFQSSPNHWSLPTISTKEWIDIEYAASESDSDLDDDEKRILMHARWSNLAQDDMDDDESTLKWRLNIPELA